MKKLFLTSLLIPTLCSLLSAQSDVPAGASSAHVEKMMGKVSFINPSIGAEFGLSRKSTIGLSAYIGAASKTYQTENLGDNLVTFDSYSAYFGVLEAEFRNYVGLDKRALQGLNTSGNSANYIGFNVGGSFDPFAESRNGDHFYNYDYGSRLRLGMVYGFQRTVPRLSNFLIGARIGPGITSNLSSNETDFDLIWRFTLGFAFGHSGK